MSGEARCKRCGELILWVTMVKADRTKGKPNPLDAVPVKGGNIERKRNTAGEWFGRVVPEADRGDRALYISHFVTCPYANSFRSRS